MMRAEQRRAALQALGPALEAALTATVAALGTAARAVSTALRGLRPVAAASGTPPADPPAPAVDVDAFAGRNARTVIADLATLDGDELRRLRTAEADGKARKTVLEAIDRALDGR